MKTSNSKLDMKSLQVRSIVVFSAIVSSPEDIGWTLFSSSRNSFHGTSVLWTKNKHDIFNGRMDYFSGWMFSMYLSVDFCEIFPWYLLILMSHNFFESRYSKCRLIWVPVFLYLKTKPRLEQKKGFLLKVPEGTTRLLLNDDLATSSGRHVKLLKQCNQIHVLSVAT